MSGLAWSIPTEPIDPAAPIDRRSLLAPLCELLHRKAIELVGDRVNRLGFEDYLLELGPGARDGLAWDGEQLVLTLANPGGTCGLYVEAVGHWMTQILAQAAVTPPACCVASNLRPAGLGTREEIRARARPLLTLAREHWYVRNPTAQWPEWVIVNNDSERPVASLSKAQQQSVFCQTRADVSVRGLRLGTRDYPGLGPNLYLIWRGGRIDRRNRLLTDGPEWKSIDYADLDEDERASLKTQLDRVACNCKACERPVFER